jgi:hypothetical protein
MWIISKLQNSNSKCLTRSRQEKKQQHDMMHQEGRNAAEVNCCFPLACINQRNQQLFLLHSLLSDLVI